MKKPTPTSTGIAMALGFVGGCSGSDPAPGPSSEQSLDPAAVAATHEAIRADLERLRALDVFSVGGIVRDLPQEATGCYVDDIGGRPCPGWEDDVAAADAEKAPRLAQFTMRAEGAVFRPDPRYILDEGRIAADLEALRALQIVEVGDLVITVPENNPNCYDVPCPEDEARAAEENRVRGAKLASINKAVTE